MFQVTYDATPVAVFADMKERMIGAIAPAIRNQEMLRDYVERYDSLIEHREKLVGKINALNAELDRMLARADYQ